MQTHLVVVDVLVITGGEGPLAPFLRHLAASADFVIAADSGLDRAREAGLTPELIVGDFDSLADKGSLSLYEKEHILQFPVDKDATDTEIALDMAFERGPGRVVLAGGGGGRLDHLIGLVSLFRRDPSPDEWHTAGESAFRLKSGEECGFKTSRGAIVSVFPLFERSGGMSSKGLKWPLEGLAWGPGEFGVSNVALGDQVYVKSGSSDLLVILPLGTERLA